LVVGVPVISVVMIGSQSLYPLAAVAALTSISAILGTIGAMFGKGLPLGDRKMLTE